jgi:hypothetical protein
MHKLSEQLAMDMRMAQRGDGVELIVPSVVHLKLGHYAAITRKQGDWYLLQDPTFGRHVWATRKAMETESSGYFLIPAAYLVDGWRAVDESEGQTVWGKGYTCCSDPGPLGPCDPSTKPTQRCCTGGGGFGGGNGGGNGGGGDGGGPFTGLPIARVHLMLVSLNIVDEPVGYTPPVGPPVRFTVRYGQRDENGRMVSKSGLDFQRRHRGRASRDVAPSNFFHVPANPRQYRNSALYLEPNAKCTRSRRLNRPKPS